MADAITFSLLVKNVERTRAQLRGVEGSVHDVGRAADTTGGRFRRLGRETDRQESGFRRLRRSVLGAAAGFIGGYGLVEGLKAVVGGYRESQKIGAQTEAVIKSTGGAANVTSDHVSDLAGRLSMMAGVDDELIQSGENLLLTFTKVRNEVGRGNQVFDDATAVALDMSVAMKQPMKNSAILVGKALNDPVKGITSLTRVGVTFTKQQREQIKAMAESGDMLGAQKVILRELRTEFGGSAKAQATNIDRLKVIGGNAAEWIGGKLVPALEKSTRYGVGFLQWVTGSSTSAQTLRVALQVLLPALTAMFVVTKLVAMYRALTAGQIALNIAMRANPVALVVTAIVALGAGLVVAYKRSATFRAVARSAFGAARTGAIAVRDAVGWIVDKVQSVIGWLERMADRVKSITSILPGNSPDYSAQDVAAATGGRAPGGGLAGLQSQYGQRATGGRVQPWERATLVGERGPELVRLPPGSQVTTARATRQMQPRDLRVIVPVVVDGREVARAVARVNLADEARV